jgi:hypothetical protein
MAQLKNRKTSDSVREEIQIMTLLIRKNETQFEKHELGEFRFVPLLEDKTRIHSISRYKNVFIGPYDRIALNFSAAAINNRKSSVFLCFGLSSNFDDIVCFRYSFYSSNNIAMLKQYIVLYPHYFTIACCKGLDCV